MTTETVNSGAIVDSAIATEVPATQTTEATKVEATAEAPAVDTTKEVTSDLETTKKLALLTKREKQVFEAKKQWEAEKLAWETQKAELEQKAKIAEAIKNKDWKSVKEHFDYNDYTKFLLNGEQPSMETAIEKVKAELEQKMEAKLTEKEKQLAEVQAKALEEHQTNLVNNFKMQIKDDLTKDFTLGDESKFQFLSLQDSPEGLVYDVINDYYEKTKASGTARVLKTQEAAEMVENYLAEQFKKTYLKPKKVRSILEEAISAQKANATDKSQPLFTNGQKASTGASTLTNGQTTSPTTTQQAKKTISREESLAEAARLLKFI